MGQGGPVAHEQLLQVRSIGRLERLVEQRAYDALHDPLSGLPNRRAFNEAVDRAMNESAGHGGARGVVLLLDLDDFKDVNDTLGHSAGDRLITVSGERLRTKAHGMVARLGGDEFAVLLPGSDEETALTIAESIVERVNTLRVQDLPRLTVSCGVAVFPSDGIAATWDQCPTDSNPEAGSLGPDSPGAHVTTGPRQPLRG